LEPGNCTYIELHNRARFTLTTGNALRGNENTTPPGRFVKRFALFITTDVFVSVTK
jgi:hypothetical protein